MPARVDPDTENAASFDKAIATYVDNATKVGGRRKSSPLGSSGNNAKDVRVFGRRARALTCLSDARVGPMGQSQTLVDRHEGDWENIVIKLDNKTNSPKAIYYAAHGSQGCTLPWSKVPKTKQGHPLVWFAEGTHASYPPYADTVEQAAGIYKDHISANGIPWFATNNLQTVYSLDWWLYRGNWGQIGKLPDKFHTWGPTGPSPEKDSVPNFNSHECSLNPPS